MKNSYSNYLTVYPAVACGMLLLLSAKDVQASVISSPIVNPGNGHTYLLLNYASWTDSEAEAITLGGHLVTINNAQENDFVYDTFVPLLPITPSLLWIGFNDIANEGIFEWVSGEPVTYTNWQAPQQPDNARGEEDYVWMWTPQGIPQSPQVFRQWNDGPNVFGNLTYGVVEVPSVPASVPEPSNVGSIIIVGIGLLGFRFKIKRDTE